MASILAVVVSFVLATLVSSATRPLYNPAQPPYRPPPPPPPPTTSKPYQPEPYKTPSGSAARSYSNQYNSPHANVPYNGDYRDGYNQQPYEQPPVYKSPSPYEKDEDETDEVDRLNAAIDSIATQLDSVAVSLANFDSQESLQKKQITQLTILDLPALEEKNAAEDELLEALEKKLEVLERESNDLEAILVTLEYLNVENTEEIKELEIALAKQQFIDSKQVHDIAYLLSAAQNLESKVLIIVRNAFKSLEQDIHDVVQSLNSIRTLENSRICETGVTTLTSGDKRSIILFNTDFNQEVPQILYGIVGIRHKFEVEERMKYSYAGYGTPYQSNYPEYGKSYDTRYSQYGSYPYKTREVGSVGDLVFARATTDGITLQFVDQSIGDAESMSLDVTWRACSIGPGTELVY